MFDKLDFDKMTYKIYGNKKTVKDFADFAPYVGEFLRDDLPHGLDADMVFRYLCYMYDPNSPGINQYPDLKRRKAWAMQMFNIEPPYNETIDAMLRWSLKPVNKRAVLFMLVVGGEKYAMWQHLLEKQQQLMEAEINFDDKDAVMAENTKIEIIKKVNKELIEAKTAFLNGEKSMELEKELMNFTLKDSLGLRPEEYIRNFEREGHPFPEMNK
jgi:hypothetical protein